MARFDRASAVRYADLAVKIIANKSTDCALNKAGKDTGSKVALPEGHGRESIYFRLCRDARNLHSGIEGARRGLIDLAYEVANDLIINCGPALVNHPVLHIALRVRKWPEVKTHVADLSNASRYNQRVDLFDRDDEATTPQPARLTLSEANAADDAEEIRRAGAPHEVAA